LTTRLTGVVVYTRMYIHTCTYVYTLRQSDVEPIMSKDISSA